MNLIPQFKRVFRAIKIAFKEGREGDCRVVFDVSRQEAHKAVDIPVETELQVTVERAPEGFGSVKNEG